MNKRQKEVLQSQLDNEKAVIKQLEKQYQVALKDIKEKVKLFDYDINMLDEAMNQDNLDDAARAVMLSQKRSKAYQKQYQEALQKQLEGILEKLHSDEYATLQQYLNDSYNDAFLGTMYDLHGQGVPLIMPINQAAAVKAILTDSKISKGLYTSLGVDVNGLKKTISAEITRGIASGMAYNDIARNISNVSTAPLSRAKTIARTEGHRIQQASNMDAQNDAKAKGADVKKQWDSTIDGDTRPNHRKLDGQIREIDEPFEVNGKKAMAPGHFGDPAEDCNCRCVSLTRAKWALDEDELQTLKERAEFFGLDKAKDFEEFKATYLRAAEDSKAFTDKFVPAKTKEEAEKFAKDNGVKYADYSKLPIETANELNNALLTIPEDIRPVFVGDSATLEKYWGGKLPRSSKQFYGVTIDVFDGIHLGYGNGIDWDATGKMVGISSHYKTMDKITAAKQLAQEQYQKKYGRNWFFNVTGKTTPYHEMGHVYADAKGLPAGFEADALRWAKESKCDMLQKPTEAWAEAWAAYHTKSSELPSYISKYIESASKNAATKGKGGLIFFDDDGIILQKRAKFKEDFAAGKISTIISPQKQARHIKGTKQFEEYKSVLQAKGDNNLPSYIRDDLTNNDLKKLVVEKLEGKVRVNADNSFDEFVMCDDVIGYYYSPSKGEYIATKCAQVKYSLGKNQNIHIIPVKEKAVSVNE